MEQRNNAIKKNMSSKKILLCLCVAELAILFLFTLMNLRSGRKEPIVVTEEELLTAQSGDNERVVDSSAYIDASFDGYDRRIVYKNRLDRGVYTITVNYETDTPATSKIGPYAIATDEEEMYSWVVSEKVFLRSLHNQESYRLHVKKNDTPVRFLVMMDDESTDYIRVDSVSVVYMATKTLVTDLVKLFLLMAIADCFVWFCILNREKTYAYLCENKRFIPLAVLTVIFIAVNLPMTMDYVPKGYDQRFHYYRIYSMAKGLQDGMFPVKIQPLQLNGYGYANGIFYGDLLMYIPAFMYLIGFRIATAYKTYILMINAIAVAVSYGSFKTMTKNMNIGLMCTGMYVLGMPRLVAGYQRCDLGAFLAISMLPLVALGVYKIYFAEEMEDKCKLGWLWLTLGLTGIVETHVLGFMGTVIFLVIIAVLCIKRTFTPWRIVELLKAVVATILLNAFFLIPFLDSYFSFELLKSERHICIYRYSVYLSQLFSAEHNAVADVDQDMFGMFHDMPMTLTPMAGVILLLGILYYFFGKRKDDKKILRTLLLFQMITIWMVSNWFPYKWLSVYMTKIYDFFQQFQMAWRFLPGALIANVCIFALMAKEMKESGELYGEYREKIMLGLLVISIAFAGFGVQYLERYCDEMIPFEHENSFQELSMESIYTGEYLPHGFDRILTCEQTEIETSDLGCEVVLDNRKDIRFECTVNNQSGAEQYVQFPLLMYKGYRAKAASGYLPVEYGDNFRVKITIPSGYNGRLVVDFVEPWYWRMAEVITLLSVVALIGGTIFFKRKAKAGIQMG